MIASSSVTTVKKIKPGNAEKWHWGVRGDVVTRLSDEIALRQT